MIRSHLRQLGATIIARGFSRRQALLSAAGWTVFSVAGCRTTQVSAQPAAVERLAKSFSGTLLTREHAAYDSARRTASFNPRYNYFPALIAACADENDVRRALAFGREQGLEIAVRSGGHDVLAASSCDGGLIIDMSQMHSVSKVDTGGRVRIAAGALAGQVNDALAESGRLAALGCNPRVGVSGLTLGGGMGWLNGRYGATCDTVLGAKIVTVDGQLLRLNRDDNSDLFWAVRGGGGNFGIVTEWRFQTFVQDSVTSGYIVYPGHQLADFLVFYRDELERAPNELTVELIGLGHREPVFVAVLCYSGASELAEEVLRPWLTFGSPLTHNVARRPYNRLDEVSGEVGAYLQWQPEERSDEARSGGSYWQGKGVSAISDGLIAAIVDTLSDAPRGWSWGLGHVVRGASAQLATEGSTSFHRKAGYASVHFDGGWDYASDAGPMMNWIDGAIDHISPFAGNGEYINYLSSDDQAYVRAAYGPHYRRLAEIKGQYDPSNILQRNRNIPPA